MNKELMLREAQPSDYAFIQDYLAKYYGGEPLVIRAKKYYADSLPGIVAVDSDKIIGFLLYEVRESVCEIIVFEVVDKFKGIGTMMLEKLKAIAKDKNCTRLYLMTTNDNIDAFRFYQRRGFHICGIHIDSVKISRQLKPTIGEIGDYGIPVRDEIDLELLL